MSSRIEIIVTTKDPQKPVVETTAATADCQNNRDRRGKTAANAPRSVEANEGHPLWCTARANIPTIVK